MKPLENFLTFILQSNILVAIAVLILFFIILDRITRGRNKTISSEPHNAEEGVRKIITYFPRLAKKSVFTEEPSGGWYATFTDNNFRLRFVRDNNHGEIFFLIGPVWASNKSDDNDYFDIDVIMALLNGEKLVWPVSYTVLFDSNTTLRQCLDLFESKEIEISRLFDPDNFSKTKNDLTAIAKKATDEFTAQLNSRVKAMEKRKNL